MTPEPHWQLALDAANLRIRERIRKTGTLSLLRHCGEFLLNSRVHGLDGVILSSPVRQIHHLLGVMLATPCAEDGEIGLQDWKDLLVDLETAFSQYAMMFFPEPDEYPALPQDWWKIRALAMPAYLDYFNTLPLLHTDQTKERVIRWYGPFADYFFRELHLTPQSAQDIVAWLGARYGATLEKISAAQGEVCRALALQYDTAREQAIATLKGALEPLYTYSYSALVARFGQQAASAFVSLFASWRGSVSEYSFPTEPRNPALARPFIWIDEEYFGCADLSVAHTSILTAFDEGIRTSPHQQQFLTHRANDTVAKTREIFELFLPEARIWESVQPFDHSSEHDLLIEVGATYLVIEVKSTPQREPFRDPQRAYTRLNRSFKSDTGLQTAYDQAQKLYRCLKQGDLLQLQTGEGEALSLLPGPREVFSICVTADSQGVVASDLSLLLERDSEHPYPWAVGLYDLDSVLDAFKELGKTFKDFVRFLQQRSEIHGKISGSDELEFVGAFLRFGGFESILAHGRDHYILDPTMSDIFDELYMKRLGLGLGPSIEKSTAMMKAPSIHSLASAEYLSHLKSRFQGIGRNDPCPCGSGKKFKRCHYKIINRL